MIEQHIDITTADGAMNSFVVHPEEGGPFPVVLFYMDAPGKREELHDMARRLAAVGYYVVLPNLYYRRTRDYWLKERTEPAMARDVRAHGDARRRRPRECDTEAMLRLRRRPARGRRQAHRRGRLLHERAVRDVGGGRRSRTGSPASPRSTAPAWSPTSPTRRTGWRRRSAAKATSPAPRSTSGRRRPTSPSSRRRCATPARRTASSGTRAPSTASSSRCVPASTTSRPRSGTGKRLFALFERTLQAVVRR